MEFKKYKRTAIADWVQPTGVHDAYQIGDKVTTMEARMNVLRIIMFMHLMYMVGN